MGKINNAFPCPGGGITLDRIPELAGFYGTDVIYLIGAGLISHGPDIAENCREFIKMTAGKRK